MYNQNQLTSLYNQQAMLQQEPNYSQQINLPRTIQIQDPQLFTGLFWFGRWTLQQLISDPYFYPTWNVLSENNFENQAYAKVVDRMCSMAIAANCNQSQMYDAVLIPVLEMDAAVRWFNVGNQAQQILPPEYLDRVMYYKQQADNLLASLQPRNSFPQQQQSNGWAAQNRAQPQSFGRMQTAGFNQVQRTSGTNKSGFFADASAPVPSSVNAAGIRTTTSALEKTTTPVKQQPTPVDNSWGSRSAVSDSQPTSGMWQGKSSQELAATTQVTRGINPLDDMLPQQEWKVDDVVVPQIDKPRTGDSTMTHAVNVSTATAIAGMVIPVSEISCPVLRSVASERFGEFLPEGVLVTGRNGENNVLMVPNGQTDIQAEIEANKFEYSLAYDSDEKVLVDYIWADYDVEKILGKTVAIDNGDNKMDYHKHTLSGPVNATNAKHHVEYANIVTPTTKVSEVGLITKHGKVIDSSKTGYSNGTDLNLHAASIKVQSSSVDKSSETYDKLVVPFVVSKDFDLEILTKLFDASAQDFEVYSSLLDELPRDMQLYVSYRVLSDAQIALDHQLRADIEVSEFDDIGDMEQYLRDNRGATMADKWAELLTSIMRNNIRTVPDTMRIAALEALGDSIPKNTDNLVLLERESYRLNLPYTLSELNIVATDDKLFYVQDASHAKLHTVMSEVFARLVKTNISSFELHLADGSVYRICKLVSVAKTYTFSKIA